MSRALEPGFPKLDKATRPWKCRRDDPTCTRAKPCRADLGARSRRSGLKKQREARKTIERSTGTQAGRYSSQTGAEENWRLSIRVEAKSGAQVKPIVTRYLAARAQSDMAHARGDPRPFAFVAIPDGWPAGKFLYVIASDEAEAFAAAFYGEMGP